VHEMAWACTNLYDSLILLSEAIDVG
jgi:hypothetical protein